MDAWPTPNPIPQQAAPQNRHLVAKITLGVFLGLLVFGGACTVLAVGGVVAGSAVKSDGVCDENGCSTREAAVKAAQKHAAARPNAPFAGICLEQGRDTWWSWSLTAAGCDYPEVFAPLG